MRVIYSCLRMYDCFAWFGPGQVRPLYVPGEHPVSTLEQSCRSFAMGKRSLESGRVQSLFDDGDLIASSTNQGDTDFAQLSNKGVPVALG